MEWYPAKERNGKRHPSNVSRSIIVSVHEAGTVRLSPSGRAMNCSFLHYLSV